MFVMNGFLKSYHTFLTQNSDENDFMKMKTFNYIYNIFVVTMSMDTHRNCEFQYKLHLYTHSHMPCIYITNMKSVLHDVPFSLGSGTIAPPLLCIPTPLIMKQ